MVEERNQAITEAEKRFRSDESTMEEININDLDAMQSKIESKRQAKIEKGINPDASKKAGKRTRGGLIENVGFVSKVGFVSLVLNIVSQRGFT